MSFLFSRLRPCSTSVVRLASSSSSSCQHVLTEVLDEPSGLFTLTLNRPPVNSFSREFMETVGDTLERVQSDPLIKGLVVTSSNPSILSAGLDLTEMYQCEEESLRVFWKALQRMWYLLYTFEKPVAAAICGHAPAAGTLIPVTSDYRVMLRGSSRIGLNEAQFGLVAPFFLSETFRGCLDHRKAEMALQLGTLFTPEEALKVGLVDDLADTKEEVMKKCISTLIPFTKVHQRARHLTKLQSRQALINRFQMEREADVDNAIELIMADKVQKALGTYLASLSSSKKQGK